MKRTEIAYHFTSNRQKFSVSFLFSEKNEKAEKVEVGFLRQKKTLTVKVKDDALGKEFTFKSQDTPSWSNAQEILKSYLEEKKGNTK